MTDIFRQKYRELNDSEKEKWRILKHGRRTPCRDRTKYKGRITRSRRNLQWTRDGSSQNQLEECVMWAVKGLTK